MDHGWKQGRRSHGSMRAGPSDWRCSGTRAKLPSSQGIQAIANRPSLAQGIRVSEATAGTRYLSPRPAVQEIISFLGGKEALGPARAICCHLVAPPLASDRGTEPDRWSPIKSSGGGRCAPARGPGDLGPRPLLEPTSPSRASTTCLPPRLLAFSTFPPQDRRLRPSNDLGLTRRLEPLRNSFQDPVFDRQAILAEPESLATHHQTFSPESPPGFCWSSGFQDPENEPNRGNTESTPVGIYSSIKFDLRGTKRNDRNETILRQENKPRQSSRSTPLESGERRYRY
ncbi:hypothetical protein QBC39DRAFT_127786 [Podospora conica]|nr:hypothetical protein QBC39DRAFT_127786 [Schizothecium conicum]